MSKAHNLDEKERTKDVLIDEELNFNALLLSEPTLTGLRKNGFVKPSPIQLKAIPIGKCGFDLIVKSKSGTGKTLVFGLIALESINLNKKHVQVLILAPTREIAVQIQNVIKDLGMEYKGLCVESFIGGLPLEDDVKKAQKCHIAVGAPGRIRHLIQISALNLKQVKLFILDEVDKLMVQNGRVDIEEIASKLPIWKQTIAVSATLTEETEGYLEKCMSSPTIVEPTTESPLLLGIRQFVDIVKSNLNIVHQLDIKNKELIRLLSQISFTQSLVFTNYQTRAASVCSYLNRNGWNAMYISADQKQSERLRVIEALRNGKCRILLSTDLTARGIDASNVDLTINYDVPYEANTYLHRMGRAGRYGSKGLCISIATEEELTGLKKLLGTIAGANFLIARLPKHGDLPLDLINLDSKALEFEQSVVDLVNNTQENQNIISSVVDLKTSKITKKSPNKSISQKELTTKNDQSNTNFTQHEFEFNSAPASTVENTETQQESLKDINLNARCFSQMTITGSDTTLDQTETVDNVENPDLKSLLMTLEESNMSLNVSDNKTNMDLSLDAGKKRKRTVNSSENICNRNIALFHVAEALDNSIATEIPNENKSVLKQLMHGLQPNCSTNSSEEKHEETLEEVEVIPQTTEEPSIDNIFQLSYDYAIKPDAPNWVETLGIDLEEKAVLTETEPKEVLSFDRSPSKRHKSSRRRKNLDTASEKLDRLSNDASDTNQTKSLHLNTSFADDSYSNTPTESLSNHKNSQILNRKHSQILNSKNSEIIQHESESSQQNLAEPRMSTIQNHFQPIGKHHFHPEHCEHEYSGNQHFTDCFQKYSDELSAKLQTFNDMASFETWYQHWQWQVQSVRDYVQQNIYVQEMNKYMYGGT